MTSKSTPQSRNPLRLRAAGVLAAVVVTVGLGAAQSANAWVYLGGVPVRIIPNYTTIEDNYVTCNVPTVWTGAEEYKRQFVLGPHGGVYVQAWFHIREANGYWNWSRPAKAWTPLGDYGGVFQASKPAPRYESDAVNVYFERWSTKGYWQHAYERATPYITSDAWKCLAEHQGLL